MKNKDFLNIADFSKKELLQLLTLAKKLKSDFKEGSGKPYLKGKTLALIFEKPSNRTRVSFEVGMYQLGGMAMDIKDFEIKMGERETVADVARTMSRYVDAVMIRAFKHETVVEFAKNSNVPVINGLCDMYHPCQAVADILTVIEKKIKPDKLRLCYLGDGNNVCHSLMQLVSILEGTMVVGCPKGYEPKMRLGNVAVTHEPTIAVRNADIVYTDVWTSMGQEEETEKRLQAFKPFSVTEKLMKYAKSSAYFMHCLPAHRGEEVEAAVMESPRSIVFDQAENRLHAQKAILVTLLNDEAIPGIIES